jgi:hypothetical protein
VTRWRTLVLVAVVAALLAGCDLATGTVRTATELQRAGIDNPNLNTTGARPPSATTPTPIPLDARDEQDRRRPDHLEEPALPDRRIVITSDSGARSRPARVPRAAAEEQLRAAPGRPGPLGRGHRRRATLIAGVVGWSCWC